MKRSRAAACAASAMVLALTGVLATPAAATGGPVTHEENDRVPEGAAWTQHYFPSSDGSDVELHADVLLPEDLPEGGKVPVILSAGSYFGHSGQLDVEDWQHAGPSARFNDFIEGTDLFDRGYAFVMVDVRGFGGSTGCLDFAGPGEQADVKAAIDWAASQPWSTGAVGMYGKSYDAITGLVGNNLNQDALKAVVAQEPIWDLYRNIRSNGVPRSTIVNVSNTYNKIATLPQLPDDDPRYLANAEYEEAHPECLLANTAGYQTADPASEYWRVRDLAAGAQGSDTPLFVTQGFLEWNTEPEAIQEYLENHQGPQRGWLGQWDHKRGNDRTPDGRLEMGREGWFAETMSFYDQYLKGIEPPVRYPDYAIQDSTGTWRAQDSWPVADGTTTISLGDGSYVDNGAEAGPAPENSFFTWSEPLAKPTRLTGTPRLSLTAEGHGNVMVKLYDVAPDGTAVMFDEQVSTVDGGELAFDLKSTDWTLPAGHALAVEIGTIQANALNDWIDTPSRKRIEVTGARLALATDDPADDVATEGARAPYLDTYLGIYTSKLPIGEPEFTLP
ncbi:CocE/NonD family hydrolase [Amycolatopsis albispora]|uniref:Xaa-Pro dipeptidyl-peptidase C-terminal domain-containing protein n=1 Tax=Amycolatopsis albispora TaxID=1804986 RepID=A0A344L029_9PSEU|nr:CocE/NonD family hydrolase [Amycolatopsis albispora]AXB41403.1 hypothetical protein A4R43_01750 [Amycolatopsis albispora]